MKREECVSWMPARKAVSCKGEPMLWYAHCIRGRSEAYDGLCGNCPDAELCTPLTPVDLAGNNSEVLSPATTTLD